MERMLVEEAQEHGGNAAASTNAGGGGGSGYTNGSVNIISTSADNGDVYQVLHRLNYYK